MMMIDDDDDDNDDDHICRSGGASSGSGCSSSVCGTFLTDSGRKTAWRGRPVMMIMMMIIMMMIMERWPVFLVFLTLCDWDSGMAMSIESLVKF